MPCSPNHQQASAPKTAMGLPAETAVPYGLQHVGPNDGLSGDGERGGGRCGSLQCRLVLKRYRREWVQGS